MRRKLNHAIRSLAHGILSLDEDSYRSIVESVTGRRRITECDDEEANLVYLALKRMRDNTGVGSPVKKNVQQQKFIARLMDHLKWDWSATAEFCFKVTGKRSTKGCNAAELSKVIRGMIAIIDHDLAKGRIVFSHTERFNYDHYTKLHREQKL
jgi:hypothetical protein